MEREQAVPRKILILLDSPEVRSEVTTYSVELARRMGAGLHLLMLLRWEGSPGDGDPPSAVLYKQETLREDGRIVLKDCLEEIRGLGVEVVGEVRQGDRSSELLKYLADHKPFQAVVWGGNEVYLRRRRTPVRTHWLERVRDELECTLVVPSLKKKQTGTG
jgi:hypothetical protein